MPPRTVQRPQNRTEQLLEEGVGLLDSTGQPITALNPLPTTAAVVPAPPGTNDYHSAEVDETGIPLAPLPAPPLTLALLFIDFATLLPFNSVGFIIENNNPAGGFPLWISFSGGGPGTYHRIMPGRGIAWDTKGAAGVIIRDSNPAGGSSYSVHVWG
jgi:hypothetical protein